MLQILIVLQVSMKNIIVFIVIIAGLSLLALAGPALALNSPCALCWQFVSLGYYEGTTVPSAPGTPRPVFVDIDGDGLQDLFMGYSYVNPSNGNDHHDSIVFYHNIGDPKVPKWQWVTNTLFDNNSNIIDTGKGSYPTPAFVDIDGDGDQDLFIGKYDGTITFYRNIGVLGVPNFKLESNFYKGIDVGYYAAPAFADIDKDGKQDLFIGGVVSGVGGALSFYHNISSKCVLPPCDPTWDAPISYSDKVWLNNSGPLPTFVDIDGDGDQDLFIGSRAAGDL